MQRSGKLKLGLVSSESKEVIDHILKQINVNPAVFDVIVNNHDYSSETQSDSFLIAAKSYGWKTITCTSLWRLVLRYNGDQKAGMDAIDVKYLKDYPNAIAKKWTRLDSLFLAYSGVVTTA